MADAAAAPAAAAGSGQAPAPAKKGLKGMAPGRLMFIMRVLNVLNGLGLILLSILTVAGSTFTFDISALFIAFYILVFGALLMCTELHFWKLDNLLRKRFGFMFSFIGRAVFIFFTASLLFALGGVFGYLAGALTVINGIFNCMVIAILPKDVKATSDPYKSYTGGEKEMANYLKKHPEIARKALSTGVDVARSNPALGAAAVRAATAPSSASGDNPFNAV